MDAFAQLTTLELWPEVERLGTQPLLLQSLVMMGVLLIIWIGRYLRRRLVLSRPSEAPVAEPLMQETEGSLQAFKTLVQSLSDKLHKRLSEILATMEDKLDCLGCCRPCNISSRALKDFRLLRQLWSPCRG